MVLLVATFIILLALSLRAEADEERKIIKGKDAKYSNFPHMVSITIKNYMCGGSLITYQHVLTAAHCVPDNTKPQDVIIQAGSNVRGKGGDFVGVKSIMVHPDYNYTSNNNDIAILSLERPVKDSHVIPARLADHVNEKINGKLYLAGWGRTENGYNRDLQEIQLVYAPRTECESYYKEINMAITENMICAKYIGGNGDACEGDSGGPLMEDNNLVGLVSFGAVCPSSGHFPGVYTKVAMMRPFIKSVTGLI